MTIRMNLSGNYDESDALYQSMGGSDASDGDEGCFMRAISNSRIGEQISKDCVCKNLQYTPWKTNMSPKNQWLEDVFPIEIVPF